MDDRARDEAASSAAASSSLPAASTHPETFGPPGGKVNTGNVTLVAKSKVEETATADSGDVEPPTGTASEDSPREDSPSIDRPGLPREPLQDRPPVTKGPREEAPIQPDTQDDAPPAAGAPSNWAGWSAAAWLDNEYRSYDLPANHVCRQPATLEKTR